MTMTLLNNVNVTHHVVSAELQRNMDCDPHSTTSSSVDFRWHTLVLTTMAHSAYTLAVRVELEIGRRWAAHSVVLESYCTLQ